MQSRMNLKIKFRESFRPFAPSVLEEKTSEWFELNEASPYMLLVADVSKKYRLPSKNGSLRGLDKLKEIRSQVPAITHVDYSARLQTVDLERNPIYHALIKKFYEHTGCPVIINTSFNVRGEPIVCSPQDAFRCFMRTEMDCLILGNFILDKRKQKQVDLKKEEAYFELD
jgi:carbamoyltransferase